MFVLRKAACALACFFAVMALGAAQNSAKADIIRFWEKPETGVGKAQASSAKAYGKTPRKYARKAQRKKLGGYAAASEPKRYRGKRVRVAALGNSYLPSEIAKPSVGGGSGAIRWAASSSCLDSALASIVASVAGNFGPVTVNSTCRSKSRNRAVGGAHRSKHLSGDAVDFRVHGNTRAVYAYLKSLGGVGGLKHYGGGLFHIDNGERRSW